MMESTTSTTEEEDPGIEEIRPNGRADDGQIGIG